MSTALVALWGTMVGLDLVSVGQVMIARPLVAATVTGLILGDPLGGGMAGVVMELFALGVLPVGASRYPDYGLGAVAAAATVGGAPGALGIGIAVAVGLFVAYLGGEAMHLGRRLNALDLRQYARSLDAGDAKVLARVHLRGLGRDAIRSLAVTAVGLLLATLARWIVPNVGSAVLMSVAAIGAGLGVAAAGALQFAGRGRALRWFGLGLAAGSAWVWLA